MQRKHSINLGHIAMKALELLREHPDGLSMAEMREVLGETPLAQEHFNRRVREIRKLYEFRRAGRNADGAEVHVLGDRKPQVDSGQVSEKLRAPVIHLAHCRYQMCCRTINDDGVKLQTHQKILLTSVGPTTMGNLRAICERDKRGARSFFASLNPEEMQEGAHTKSAKERTVPFLKLHALEPVPA